MKNKKIVELMLILGVTAGWQEAVRRKQKNSPM